MTLVRPPPRDQRAARVFELSPVAPERLLTLQLALIGLLLTLHATVKAFHLLGGHDQLFGLGPLFDLDGEANAPAYYSTLIVLANAALLGLIGTMYRRHRLAGAGYWLFLAAIFVLLAYDEAFSVHERIGLWVRNTFHNDRSQHFQWVVPGLGFAAVVALISARFLLRLDRRTRLLMLASGAIFVSGAVGFEMLGGLRYERAQPTLARPDALYVMLATAEELLEMLGMALFNYALLDHLRARFGRLAIRLGG